MTEAQKTALEESDAKWEPWPQWLIDHFNARSFVGNRYATWQDGPQQKNVFGRYNPDTGFGELNGIKDISMAEAMEIDKMSWEMPVNAASGSFQLASVNGIGARTLYPIPVGFGINLGSTPSFCTGLQVIRFVSRGNFGNGWSSPDNDNGFNVTRTAQFCGSSSTTLREVQGVLRLTGTNEQSDQHFYDTTLPKLEKIWLRGLGLNTYLYKWASLRQECVDYMIKHAGSLSKAITLGLHPDVYAGVSEATFALAAEKKITISTTS